jgi:Flagellar hook capping protein
MPMLQIGVRGLQIYQFYEEGIEEESEIPVYFLSNYPNPFSSSTTISFDLHRRGAEGAKINIYNIKGQLVRKLEGSISNLGFGKAVWDGRDENGKPVSSGIYFYKLETDNSKSQIRKMLLIR